MEIGSEWRGWTVAEYLGGGSFGKVYRIVREEFGFKYEAALKVIRIPHNEDEINAVRNEGMTEDSVDSYFYSVVKGISSELALLSQLSGNSNIVSYEDHSVEKLKNEFGWEVHLRMELVTPLYEHLKGKAITVRDVVSMGIDISRALETCEKNNIIHRDIKPDNIFYSRQGTYKLGDFGIARKLDKASSHMTKVGTFSYMAPEVYKGKTYNHTVDIYSLGLILYQFMNRNRRPFMPPFPEPVTMQDNENANMMRLVDEKMPRPCTADDRLTEIILKACAYAPSDRYQSAAELRKDLESVIDGEDAGRIIFSEWADDNTRSMVPSGSSTTDETLTMFGTVFASDSKQDAKADSDDQNHDEPVYEDKQNSIDEKKEEEKAGIIKKIDEEENETSKKAVESETTVDVATETAVESATGTEDKSAERRSPLKLIVVLVTLITVISGVFTYLYYYPTVPSVVGMSEKEAEIGLQKAGFKLGKTSYDTSKRIEKGSVISLSEKSESREKRGTVIDIVVSQGKPVSVPDFTNLNYKKAKKLAEKSGLVIRDDKEKKDWNDNPGEKGKVISQDHAKDEEVPNGTIVIVKVCDGREPVTVPDLCGKTLQEAKKLIKQSKLKLSEPVKEEINAYYANGNICNQSISANSKAYKGDAISITISKGPAPKSTYTNTAGSGRSSSKRSSSKGKKGNNSKKDKNQKSKYKKTVNL